MRDRLLSAVGRFAVYHPWWVLSVALVVSVTAGIGMNFLDILTSRTALYPKHMEVNQRFDAFLKDFGSTNSLIAVIEGDPDSLGPFAEDAADELRLETGVVSDIFYKADVDFFADRAFLFLSVDQIRKMRDKVKENEQVLDSFRHLNGLMPLLDAFSGVDSDTGFSEKINIATAKRILVVAGELFAELEQWMDEPQVDQVKLLENLFVDELSGREDYDRQGYLKSHDKKMLFMFIQPASSSEEFEVVHELVETSRTALERAAATWREQGKTPPVFGFTGLPANANEEMIAIERDVKMTVVVAAVGILLVILLGFRSIRRGIIVFIPLVLAGLWNLGLTAATVGHLTILTSGFTAILFGLGVDYGIFISGRIAEELAAGARRQEAIVAAVRTGGRTLLTAGGTTTVAFFVIGTVEFTGFAELGIVSGTGVLCVIASTLCVLPALASLIPLSPPKSKKNKAGRGRLANVPRFYTGTITFLAIAAAVASGYFAAGVPLDYDLRNILPRNSESVRLQFEMGDRSDFQPEFVAVTAATVEEARQLTEKLAALPTVSRVESVTQVLPPDQEQKIKLIREVGPVFDKILVPAEGFEPFVAADLTEKFEELLDPVEEAQERAFSAGHSQIVVELEKIIERMDSVIEKLEKKPELVERVKAFEQELFKTIAGAVEVTKRWPDVGAIGPKDLPKGIRDRFVGASGNLVIYAFPAESIYEVEFLDRFLEEIYALAPEATGFPTTHQVFSRLIMTGFRQASVLALGVVFLLLFVDFRRLWPTVLAALPLSLGAAWMFGIMYFLRIPHNYANIIALPLVIGLAVDYGVYITHRLLEDPGRHPFSVMERAAKPVVLAALTTLVGIGAICLGEHRGAASLGEALIFGIASCLVAAVVVLPSAVAFFRQAGRKGTGEQGEPI